MLTLDPIPQDGTDADLADLVRQGDRVAADLLIRRHQGVVWGQLTFARLKALGAPPGIDPRDVAQDCMVACWKAIPKWTPAKGKMSTFLTIVVRNEVSDYLRRERRVKEIPCDPRGGDDPDKDEGFLDLIPDREPRTIDLRPAIDKLPPVERCLLRAYFGIDGEPLRIRAAGDRLGLSREQAANLVDTALERLAELVDPDEVC